MVENQKRRLLIAVDVEDDLDIVEFLAGLGFARGACAGRNLTFAITEPQQGKSDDFTEPANDEPETKVEESDDSPTEKDQKYRVRKYKWKMPVEKRHGTKGKKKGARSQKQKCGKCGQSGHNRRGCAGKESLPKKKAKSRKSRSRGYKSLRWSEKEDNLLIQMKQAGLTHLVIAGKLDRTKGAVDLRLWHLRKQGRKV